MFKGLRTKIESEQKGQGNTKSSDAGHNLQFQNPKHGFEACSEKASLQSLVPNDDEKLTFAHHTDTKPVSKTAFLTEVSSKTGPEVRADSSYPNDGFNQTMEDLKREVKTLRDQLSITIKEKDESNDQNGQLYQIIEKLRRNLETEKEINASQQNKLNEVNSALKENTDLINSMKIKPANISIQPYRSSTPDVSQNAEANSVDNIATLSSKIDELQAQLSEKNRQLKIRQQNLTDIKKALQKEMSDHNRTKDDLAKLQLQIQKQVEFDEAASPQNGSTVSDTNLNQKIPVHLSSGDKHQESAQSISGSERNEEVKDNSTLAPQLDAMSCLSVSSASVDDLDSNDLHQNSCNKGVNLEYLRNVLYSYMTSTDTETTQHLIKALSVMMNFTPEQSAAVKSAMSVRSSWLRLK